MDEYELILWKSVVDSIKRILLPIANEKEKEHVEKMMNDLYNPTKQSLLETLVTLDLLHEAITGLAKCCKDKLDDLNKEEKEEIK